MIEEESTYMQELKKRKNWIDATKAIAIIIVALNHSGLVIPGVNFWGGMFFVPAFFLISGYTYHVGKDRFSDYMKKKAVRLLVPYIVTNLLLFFFFLVKRYISKELTRQYVVESFIGIFYGRNQIYADREANIYLMPNLNAPLWFLPALFVALLLLEGLYRLFREDEKKVLLVVLCYTLLATAYHYFVPVLLPWCLDIMPFFLLMMMAGKKLRQTEILEGKSYSIGQILLIVVLLLAILIGSALLNGSVNLSISFLGKSVTLMLLSSISSSILLMMFMYIIEKKVEGLSVALGIIGKHTLTILCGHYFILVMLSMFIRFKVVTIILSIAVCIFIDVMIAWLKLKRER